MRKMARKHNWLLKLDKIKEAEHGQLKAILIDCTDLLLDKMAIVFGMQLET